MSAEPVTVTISGATIYDYLDIVGEDNSFSFSSVAWDTENNQFVDATITFAGKIANYEWTPGYAPKKADGKTTDYSFFDNDLAVIGGSFNKAHSYASSNYEDKSLLYYDVTVTTKGPAVQTTGPIYIVGGTFSEITMTGGSGSGGAAFRSRGTGADVFAITAKTAIIDGKEVKVGTLITGNTVTVGIGGALHTFHSGTRWYIDGATFSKNASGYVPTTGAHGGGAICNQSSPRTMVKNTLFDSNYAAWKGGAVTVMNTANNFSAYNCRFINNSAGNNGGAINYNSGTLTVDSCYFEGNSAVGNGGAICINGSSAIVANSVFATATDTIYNSGTLTFSGNITLNANLGGTGTFNIAENTNFTIGQGVDLNGVNFSNATITVDGANYLTDTLIATGVGGAGTLNVTNNKFMILTLDGTELWLKEIAGDTITENSYIGDGLNIMDKGNVDTFFATQSDQKEIATKISGGKVESNLVAGAYVAAGNTAEVDKVELLIGGTAEVAAKVYAGGYLYGNAGDAEAAAEAQLTVGEVNINIDGGAVSTNMYGGAHARQNGNASVTEVNITVTAGKHDRIYAGGWAEKGAVSSVGTANVIISGGTVDYLYGAGANADGKTYVDTTNITIENDAVVNTIFMGGRYGYSWVENVNLTFAGAEKVLTRLSGVSSAGMDYAEATVVELETNVTADLIDYVDKFVINEGCILTAVDEFYLGDRNNETGATEDFTTFDFIADGEANWTAVAGISDFTNAKFAVNGIEGSEWKDNVMAIGDYTLTYDEDKKTITLANA